eukprot:s2917_g10.t1
MDQLKRFNQWLKEHSAKESSPAEKKEEEDDPIPLQEEEQDDEIGNLLQQYGVLLEYERTQAFNLQSRGASLDTTAAGSVQWSSYSSSSASCAGHASPVLDTSSTLIYLDWDDTLFPSTEIFDRWGLPHQWDCEGLTAKQEQLLYAWGESLQRFLKACMEYSGSCVIVTNAQSRWVENCLRRFAPELVSLFASPGGPTVLYAKEVLRGLRLRKRVRHQDDSVIPAKHVDAYWDDEDTQRFKFVEMSAAKFHAMKQEFLDFFSGREGHSPGDAHVRTKSGTNRQVIASARSAEDQRVDRSPGVAPLASARYRQSQQRHRSRLEGFACSHEAAGKGPEAS